MIYSFAGDSLGTAKWRFFQSAAFLKDGQPHHYVVTIRVAEDNLPRLLVGWLHGSEYLLRIQDNHFLIENISLSHSLQPL